MSQFTRVAESRGKEIAEYLHMEEERFFNSLVVAVYGGSPEWYETSLKVNNEKINENSISEDALHSVGFLKLGGEEKLFALDGQHRLSGIKLSITKKQIPFDDELNIILVAHKNTINGIQRTRRLFTTLNKRAVPVRKGEIIALDENDLVAIITRKMVEECELFSGDRILYKPTNNISKHDKKCLTTIGNLYDLLRIILTKAQGISLKQSQYSRRPSDEFIGSSYNFCVTFFEKMRNAFDCLDEYFSSENLEKTVGKYRNPEGGDILYRPIGLSIIVEVVSKLSMESDLDNAFRKVKKLKTNLVEEPFLGTIWNADKKTINTKGKAIARDFLLVDLGSINKEEDVKKVNLKYKNFISPAL